MTLWAQLSISEAGQPDRTIAVQGTTAIGRDNDNDIVLESITVSPCHALLLRHTTGMSLIDLASTSGTLVNGVLVPPDTLVHLADGDVIQFGQAVARYVAPPKQSPRITSRQEVPRL